MTAKVDPPTGDRHTIDRRRVLRSLGAVGALAAGSNLHSAAAQAIYRSESGNLTIALAGDTMPTRSMKPYEEQAYEELLAVLRGADVALCNLETSVREEHEGVPNVGGGGGTPMTTPPVLLEDLKWMGIDGVSYANNHVTDYGPTGLLAGLRHLRAANLPFAGAGASLIEARRPGYVDTRSGRVALVAAASTGAQNTAADPRGEVPGRPGLNPLAYTVNYEVDAQALAELKRIDRELGFEQARARSRLLFYPEGSMADPEEDQVRFGNLNIRQGQGFSKSTAVNAGDAEGNLRALREAARQADWQVFSLHNHEFGETGHTTADSDTQMPDPAEFWVDFAHAAVDAGADVVFGHGPHVTLGVEIYNGRPIFYSLGNFIFQNDTIESVPPGYYRGFGLGAEATPADFMDARSGDGTRSFEIEAPYWESIVPVCEFRARRLVEVRLYPVDLGFGRSRAERGRPVQAHGTAAQRILDRVIERSRKFGTRIEVEAEIGLIRPG